MIKQQIYATLLTRASLQLAFLSLSLYIYIYFCCVQTLFFWRAHSLCSSCSLPAIKAKLLSFPCTHTHYKAVVEQYFAILSVISYGRCVLVYSVVLWLPVSFRYLHCLAAILLAQSFQAKYGIYTFMEGTHKCQQAENGSFYLSFVMQFRPTHRCRIT